jgi:hypothetical protein
MTLFPCAQIRRPAALHGLGGEREVKRHPRSLADATLSFDEATVGLYYGLGDGEAQPGAFLPARPGFVLQVASRSSRKVFHPRFWMSVVKPT